MRGSGYTGLFAAQPATKSAERKNMMMRCRIRCRPTSTERRGRPNASASPTDVARPRSLRHGRATRPNCQQTWPARVRSSALVRPYHSALRSENASVCNVLFACSRTELSLSLRCLTSGRRRPMTDVTCPRIDASGTAVTCRLFGNTYHSITELRIEFASVSGLYASAV